MIAISANLHDEWVVSDFTDDAHPLTVNSCGYIKVITREMGVEREHGRVDYQLILVTHGSGRFWLQGAPQTVHAGHVVLYQPGQPQRYVYPAVDGAETYWVHFTGTAVADYLRDSALLTRQVYPLTAISECRTCVNNIITEMQLKRPMYAQLCSGYLLELLTLMARDQHHDDIEQRGIHDATVQHAMQLMYQQYNQPYTVGDFARLCNVSTYHFIHKFKEATGITPMAFLRNIRLTQARYLLVNSSLTIAEIAAIVGYADPLYFSRLFKHSTGLSPSEYKTRQA
jgi:AraC-like DNA-binding protein